MINLFIYYFFNIYIFSHLIDELHEIKKIKI